MRTLICDDCNVELREVYYSQIVVEECTCCKKVFLNDVKPSTYVKQIETEEKHQTWHFWPWYNDMIDTLFDVKCEGKSEDPDYER